MGIVVIGAVFVDIKGYPLSTYIPGGRNAGRVEQVHGGVCRNVAEDIANVELRPTFVSLVDDTGSGQDVIDKLAKHKVNTKYIEKVPDGMGTWLAVFDNDGDVCAAISKRPDTTPLTGLLQEQGVKVKTHDLVESTSPTSMLKNHDVVNVQSAYQTTITIDGQEVPFWTVASSAEQLLDFFNQNETEAAKITVNISNVYNKLTGGLIINQKGPVTVIADGKSSVAPNSKLPAASILDAKGITLGKEDRVSVEKDGKTTILRVRRVTHGEETRTKEVPFGTQTIIDPNLQPGEVTVRQGKTAKSSRRTPSPTWMA